MTTLIINNDDKQILEKYIKIGQEKFHLNIQIISNLELSNLKSIEIQEENKKVKKGKWANFVKDMNGVLDSETAEHIRKNSKDFRANFQFRNLELNK